MVQFKRDSANDMRKIAYRILDEEGVKIDPGARGDNLGNPGDLRVGQRYLLRRLWLWDSSL